MEAPRIKAWHFTADLLRDGRPIPPPGQTLVHVGPVKMCRSGLHASERIIDALTYAPGTMIHRVECDDIVSLQHDKLVCRRRTILWSVDGGEILRAFARRCALDVVHLWDTTDVVVRWLRTGNPSILYAAQARARAVAVRATGAKWLAAKATWAGAEAERAAEAERVAAAVKWVVRTAWSSARAQARAAEADEASLREAQNALLEQMVMSVRKAPSTGHRR